MRRLFFPDTFGLPALGLPTSRALTQCVCAFTPKHRSVMNSFRCSYSVTRVVKTWLVGESTLALSVMASAQVYVRAPLHTVAKKNHVSPAGYYPSDVEQVMVTVARSPSEPNRIYAGQDVGGVWVSLDNGQSWNTLRNRGLKTPNVFALAVDPANADVVYALCGRRHYDDPADARMGIFRSFDGGINWEQVHSYPYEISELRGAGMKIAIDPSSVSGGRAQKIYVTLDSHTLFGSSITGRPALLRSTNGGDAFTEVRSLPAATFGSAIRGCKVDPANSNRLYVWGNKGLLRINDVNASATSITDISANTNLEEGGVYGEPYISANGQTFIVGVENFGVCKSTNSGATFSTLHSYASTRGVWVNAGDPNHIYIAGAGKEQGKYSINGSTFTSIANSATFPMPGEADDNYHQRIGGNEPVILPHPVNHDEALIFSNANFQRTLDGGVTWNPANQYFAGTHHKNMAAPQMFDPVNPQRYVLGFLDKGIAYTSDGGRSFTVPSPGLTDDTQVPTLSHTSVNGIALHPDSTKQLILASVGSEVKGRLIRSVDNGTSWSAVRDTEQPRRVVGFDAGNNAFAYQWRERSNNYGASGSWSALSMPHADAVIVGISASAYSGKSVLYAAKLTNSSGSSPIWRSLDRGDNWTLLTTVSWKLEGSTNSTVVFRVHPTDPLTFFTRSSTHHIRKWVFNAAGVEGASANFTIGTGLPSDFDITNFTVDPTNTQVMYARAQGLSNTGYYLFLSTNGGTVWTNISAGFPNAQGNGLEVNPVTGVVYLGTTNGMFVRQRATGSPVNNNTYDLLKSQYPTWVPKHFEGAYDREVELEPVADSFTYGGNTSQNNGSQTYFSAKDGSGTSSDRIIYIRFDLSGLSNYPSSATLSLRSTANTQAGTVTAREVTGAGADTWVESMITYANQPSSTGAALDTATVAAGVSADVTLNVTSFVQQEYLGDKVATIAITGDASGLVTFTAKEGTLANRPFLLIGQ